MSEAVAAPSPIQESPSKVTQESTSSTEESLAKKSFAQISQASIVNCDACGKNTPDINYCGQCGTTIDETNTTPAEGLEETKIGDVRSDQQYESIFGAPPPNINEPLSPYFFTT